MSEVPVQFRKSTAVPTLPTTPNTVFMIAPPGNPDSVEFYVSSKDGSKLNRSLNRDDVNSLIAASIASNNRITVVSDIAARDAKAGKVSSIYVVNATGDSTVKSGGASYIYDFDKSVWIKTGESESMDVVQDWNNLSNRPQSTVGQIDSAVNNTHTHPNKTQLDNLGESNGLLTYKGKLVQQTINDDAW